MLIDIIDNWAPKSLINAAKATWPAKEWSGWHAYDNGKLATKSRHELPQSIRLLLERMAQIEIPDAFPDLEQLHGAGLHQTSPGGSLGLHLDSERHPLMPWRRVATVLLYLDTTDGGELELTDQTGNVYRSIASVENRLTMFRTENQWHRVAKTNSLRRSICLFYWTFDDTAKGLSTATFKSNQCDAMSAM